MTLNLDTRPRRTIVVVLDISLYPFQTLPREVRKRLTVKLTRSDPFQMNALLDPDSYAAIQS